MYEARCRRCFEPGGLSSSEMDFVRPAGARPRRIPNPERIGGQYEGVSKEFILSIPMQSYPSSTSSDSSSS